ncbi:MAG TPA: DMT family transporter [Geminicoccaceae bacterium]|nr:DMT family transporter [Geminicoccaceae bacterium]HRY26592.1 DMT family transporter [Geminicoccaceae bacterium]
MVEIPRPTLRAAGWMLGSMISFSVMAVAARELSAAMSPFQILLLRNLFGVAFIGLFIARADPAVLRSCQPVMQLVRHSVHFIGQVLWILAIAWLPLAIVFAVEFTSPIWGALTAVLLLGERLSRNRQLAMALGFVGVLIIVRPGVGAFDPAIFAVVAAALSFGITNAMTKKLLATDRPWGILFWMCLVQTLLCLPFAIPLWTPLTWVQSPAIAGVAVAGLSAHYCLNRALAAADAVVVLPMDYARLPMIAVVGLVLYGEQIVPWTFIGAAVVFLGIWLNLRGDAARAQVLSRRRPRAATAPGSARGRPGPRR